MLFPVVKPFESLFQVFGWGVGGLGEWGVGRDKNVIHIASMPKTLVFTVFRLFVQHTVQRMWNKTR